MEEPTSHTSSIPASANYTHTQPNQQQKSQQQPSQRANTSQRSSNLIPLPNSPTVSHVFKRYSTPEEALFGVTLDDAPRFMDLFQCRCALADLLGISLNKRQLLAVIAATASPNSADAPTASSEQEEQQEQSYDVVYLPHFIAIYAFVLNFLTTGADVSEFLHYVSYAMSASTANSSPTSAADIASEVEYQAFATKAAFAQVDLSGKGYVTKHDFQEAARLVAPHLLPADKAAAIFDDADTYEAGKVTLSQFRHMVQ